MPNLLICLISCYQQIRKYLISSTRKAPIMSTEYAPTLSLLDVLEAHGVYLDTAHLLPCFSQEEDDVREYDVLTCSTHVEDGSLFLPYELTANLLEVRELSSLHNGQTSSKTHIFTLANRDAYTVMAQQIVSLIADKGQQFDS